MNRTIFTLIITSFGLLEAMNQSEVKTGAAAQTEKEQKTLNFNLHKAYCQKNIEAFKLALSQGADPNMQPKFSESPLLFNIYDAYAHVAPSHAKDQLGLFVDSLLQDPRLKINLKGGMGQTILFEAAGEADERRVNMILGFPGIEVDHQTDIVKSTTLDNLVFRVISPNSKNKEAYKRIIKLLLTHGADPEIKDVRGNNSYYFARDDKELTELIKSRRDAYLKKLKEAQEEVAEEMQGTGGMNNSLCALVSQYAVGPQEIVRKETQEEKKS